MPANSARTARAGMRGLKPQTPGLPVLTYVMLRELRPVDLSLKEQKLDYDEVEEWKLGEWESEV